MSSWPSARGLFRAAKTGVSAREVQGTVGAYRAQHRGSAAGRRADYARMVNRYYDLATDFYEFGWGQSFHFAPRGPAESFEASLLRHEHWLAHALDVGPDDHVLDVGCGVGGPMRAMARFTGARITGINNNAYQVERAQQHTATADLAAQCAVIQGDFMSMPFADHSFDAVYQIEATAHAPDKTAVYTEIARVLKPGGVFAGYEWCVTPGYEPDHPRHIELKRGIEEGNGLVDISSFSDVSEALQSAGFEVEWCEDRARASHPDCPWYLPLTGKERSARGFQRTPAGRRITHAMVRALEALRIAPSGSTEVSEVLQIGADALVAAGELGIFTPMYAYRAVRPLEP